MYSALALMEHIELPVFILEPDQSGAPIYVAMSAHACRIIGKPLDEIVGLTACDLYPGRSGQHAFDHHVAAFRSGKPSDYEITLPISGTQRRVRTCLRPELDRDGKVVRVIGSSIDFSNKSIFHEMRAEMDTLNNEMQDFISLAAHDLRAPIRNVSHIAEMLREDFTDLGDGKLELIDILEELGVKAMRLIGDVLSHAQATSAVQEIEVFEFGALTAEISKLLDPLQKHSFRYPSVMVDGDKTATQIILRNLLDNSIKYSQGEAEGSEAENTSSGLELEIQLKDSGDGFFEVTVKDNGKGFSEAALLFLQGGKLRTDSGFGLLGVRRLIEARGGCLAVSNCSDGTGASVTFTLPGTTIIPAHIGASDEIALTP